MLIILIFRLLINKIRSILINKHWIWNGPLNQVWTEDNGTLKHPDGAKFVIRK